MPTSTEWNDLLEMAKEGNPEAQNILCEKLRVRLSPILQCRLREWQSDDCEDIMQETLATFVEKIGNINSNPHMYACGILRNKIGDAIRERHKAVKIPIKDQEEKNPDHQDRSEGQVLSTGESESDFIEKLDRKIAVEDILQAVTELSDFCRTLFLAIFEGRSLKDVWLLHKKLEPNLKRTTFDKRTFECRKRIRRLVGC
jgi:DNA-directed RNA polymerase specialized sigma24 family protein